MCAEIHICWDAALFLRVDDTENRWAIAPCARHRRRHKRLLGETQFPVGSSRFSVCFAESPNQFETWHQIGLGM